MSRPDEQPADVITSAGPGSLQAAAERRTKYAKLEAQKRNLNAQIRDVQDELDALEPDVREDFIELGTDKMTATVDGTDYTLSLKPELWAGALKSGVDDETGDDKPTDEDWKRAVKAARDAGAGHLVQERFNGQSFSAWLRSFRAEHGPGWKEHLPPGVKDNIRIDESVRVRMRKA